MPYYISTPQTSFSIRLYDLPKFFDLVDNMMSDKNIEKYSWVNTKDVRKAIADKDIIEIFARWGYELKFLHEYEGVCHYHLNIRNVEAKIGDEEKFFAAIAPVVIHGCFIDVRGEDEWRWLWENGKFFSQDVVRKEVHYSEPKEILFDGVS